MQQEAIVTHNGIISISSWKGPHPSITRTLMTSATHTVLEGGLSLPVNETSREILRRTYYRPGNPWCTECFLRPMKLWEGNVFTGVCHSVHEELVGYPWYQVLSRGRVSVEPGYTREGVGYTWRVGYTPSPWQWRPLQWSVIILLECFLV